MQLLQACPLGTKPAQPRAQQESGGLAPNASGWLLRGSEPPLRWTHFPKSLQPAHYWRLITHLRRQARVQPGQGQPVQRLRCATSHIQALHSVLGIPNRGREAQRGQGPDPRLRRAPHRGLTLPGTGAAVQHLHLPHLLGCPRYTALAEPRQGFSWQEPHPCSAASPQPTTASSPQMESIVPAQFPPSHPPREPQVSLGWVG